MQQDTFTLDGSYTVAPSMGNPPGIPTIETPLNTSLQLQNKSVKFFSLASDPAPSATPVPFDFANVHVVVVQVTGGHVQMKVTSPDGASQAIPVNSVLCLITDALNPITAIDLLQDINVQVDVQIFMGELAP